MKVHNMLLANQIARFKSIITLERNNDIDKKNNESLKLIEYFLGLHSLK